MRFSIARVLALVLLAPAASAGTIYVNAALGSGANNGTSWTDAFQGSNGLQAALAAAASGDQIWVAQGSYKPTPGSDRNASFLLRNGVEVYGGFAGTESSLSQRDFVAHLTVLNGDLNGDDGSGNIQDNSIIVVRTTGTNASAVLDGCHVRGGCGFSGEDGAGMYCGGSAGPTVRNCVFRENRCTGSGGAVFVSLSSPSFTDCRFESNWCAGSGGAVSTQLSANPTFLRCVFRGNTATSGGALGFWASASASVTNCVLWNNTATSVGGGAIYVHFANPVIRQCIVAGNHSSGNAAGGILATSAISLANDVFYFNTGIGGTVLQNNVSGGDCSSCCVQGISPGAGNIASDPLFTDFAAGDLHLSATSPCADAGDNLSIPAGITTDLDGNPRLADDPLVPDTGGGFPVVDIGAYELPNTLYAPFCAGDGSLPTPCPCGNSSAPAGGRGCLNSDVFSPGALLVATGTSTPDTVVLTSSDMLPTSSCVFLQGNLQNSAGVLFGDGVRCVAGTLKRLYLKSASNGSASAPGPGDLAISARSAQLGDPIAPGSQRFYQVYYRDSNLGFCPAPQGDSWNVSSGVIVHW